MSKKPHVLHVITGLQVGGAEMMLVKALPRLSNYRHTVCTVLGRGPLSEMLESAGVRVVHLDLAKRKFAALADFWRLSREKPDLSISYLIHADLFMRVFGVLFGLAPRVVFIRNNLIGSQYDALLRLERLTSFLVSRYFSVSASVARMYQEKLGYPAQKFRIIPNGIEMERFEGAKALDRGELGVAKDELLCLCVSKFYKQKGHAYLIEAWKKVVAECPQARLLLAGDGPIRPEIEELIADSDLGVSVRFLGVRSDVPSLLKTADVFVFPTLFEGMSNALLEAMAAGCAIVTTAIPENREVAADDEVRFVPPADSEALAVVLVETLAMTASDRNVLGGRAQSRVRADFSIEQTVAKLDAAYSECIA